MAGRRLIYLAAVLGGLVFYIAYQEWMAWILLLAILGLPWFSLVLSLPAILTFRTGIAAPSHIPMHTPVNVRLQGQSRFPVPPFKGRICFRRITTGEIWTKKREDDLPTEHCGGIFMQPVRVWVCDYLGLFAFPVRKKLPAVTVIRPQILPLPEKPDLNRFLAHSWRPKPGGGYSENHELRLYRPGDSLNQVHWKLTAKTGKLILREPMEPVRGQVLVTMHLRGDAACLDRKFGQLLWLGNYLLERNIRFELTALTGEGVFSKSITEPQLLAEAIDDLLRSTPADPEAQLPSIFAAWQYHVGGDDLEA